MVISADFEKQKQYFDKKKYCFCQIKYCFINITLSLYRNIAYENRPSDESLRGLNVVEAFLFTGDLIFYFQIVDPGLNCYIAIGLARKDYPKNRHPGKNSSICRLKYSRVPLTGRRLPGRSDNRLLFCPVNESDGYRGGRLTNHKIQPAAG